MSDLNLSPTTVRFINVYENLNPATYYNMQFSHKNLFVQLVNTVADYSVSISSVVSGNCFQFLRNTKLNTS